LRIYAGASNPGTLLIIPDRQHNFNAKYLVAFLSKFLERCVARPSTPLKGFMKKVSKKSSKTFQEPLNYTAKPRKMLFCGTFSLCLYFMLILVRNLSNAFFDTFSRLFSSEATSVFPASK
jgi:hypothetical protein